MSNSDVRVFVQRDGVVLHSHAGVKGLHGPWSRHADLSLHASAATPVNAADLNSFQAAQYVESLAGKDFSFMWVQGTAVRKAAAASWNYGKARVQAAPSTPARFTVVVPSGKAAGVYAALSV